MSIREIGSSGISRRTFLIGLGGAGAAAAGGLLAARQLGWPAEDPRPLRLHELASLPGGPFDVCIVGSGPAGAVLGRDLVRRGARVVILESGLDLRTQRLDPRLAGLEVYRSSGAIEYPVAASRVRGVGGTSIVWSGACTRFHPVDFEPNGYTPAGASWPIRWDDVAGYYERADQTLRVRRGILSSFHPFLSRELDDAGIEVGGSPKSRSTILGPPVRAAPHLLPDFTESPDGTLVSGATVTRLATGAAGAVVGAEAHDLDGRSAIVRARFYVVACGGLESARLLLLSHAPSHPRGIGNASGNVGRHFMEHLGTGFRGRVRGWSTFRHEFGRSEQFYDAFKRRGLGGMILVFVRGPGEEAPLGIGASIEMAPSSENRVTLADDLPDAFGNPGLDLSLGRSPIDLQTIEETDRLIHEIFAGIGAEDVRPIVDERQEWAHHHMGTCRMGDDPATSVVDRDLRVHGTPNLYVASSAVFATSGASHPTLFIVALAHRLADHLLEQLGRGRPAGEARPAAGVARVGVVSG